MKMTYCANSPAAVNSLHQLKWLWKALFKSHNIGIIIIYLSFLILFLFWINSDALNEPIAMESHITELTELKEQVKVTVKSFICS